MRQIKFRAWDKHNKRIIQSNDGDFIGWHTMSNWRECLEVMQFTGLTDANGVEIYEGDIVRWDDASKGKLWRVAQVVWHENGTWAYRIIPSACVGCFKDGKGHDFKLGNFIYTPDSTAYGNVLEIIGNIHQNPELLEASNKT